MSGAAAPREADRLRKQVAALARFGGGALRSRALDDLLQQATQLVSDGIDVDLVKVLELLPDGDNMLVRAGVNWRPGVVGHAAIPARGGSQRDQLSDRRYSAQPRRSGAARDRGRRGQPAGKISAPAAPAEALRPPRLRADGHVGTRRRRITTGLLPSVVRRRHPAAATASRSPRRTTAPTRSAPAARPAGAHDTTTSREAAGGECRPPRA